MSRLDLKAILPFSRNRRPIPPFSLELLLPSYIRVRDNNTLIVTRQVQNSTHSGLSSSRSRETSFAFTKLIVIIRKLAYDILFPFIIIFVTIWLTSTLLRRLQRRQLSAEKSQPQPFYNLFVDRVAPERNYSSSKLSDPIPLSRHSNVDKFPDNNVRTGQQQNAFDGSGELSQSSAQLQLFQKISEEESLSKRSQQDAFKSSTIDTISDDSIENGDEGILVEALLDAMTLASDPRINDGDRKATDIISTARRRIVLSDALISSITLNVVSRIVSTAVDDVVSTLETKDSEVMTALTALSNMMDAAHLIVPGISLNYVGKRLRTDSGLEAIYRRYVVYCMSKEEFLAEELECLDRMRRFLDIYDAKAQSINVEVAKGMFQMAVSAAMASGVLTDEDRRKLDSLKNSFGDYLSDTTANSIISEVSVMRTMYALQQLVQEEHVSNSDIMKLRKMCVDLGANVDEMVKNADALGKSLGTEGKDFVIRLKGILMGTGFSSNPTYRTNIRE